VFNQNLNFTISYALKFNKGYYDLQQELNLLILGLTCETSE